MLANAIKQSTATTGTGNITLGSAAAGHLTVQQKVPVGAIVRITVEDGSNYETGYYKHISSGVLQRWYINEKLEGGTLTEDPGTPLNLSGSATVISTVAARDIQIFGSSRIFGGGQYLYPESSNITTSSQQQNGNTVVAVPITIPEPIEASALAVYVSTGGGGKSKLAIYRANETGGVGKLMFETAELDVSVVGTVDGTIGGGAAKLPPGRYWLMSWGDPLASFRIRYNQSPFGLGGSDAALGNGSIHYCMTKSVTYTSGVSTFAANVGDNPAGFALSGTGSGIRTNVCLKV